MWRTDRPIKLCLLFPNTLYGLFTKWTQGIYAHHVFCVCFYCNKNKKNSFQLYMYAWKSASVAESPYREHGCTMEANCTVDKRILPAQRNKSPATMNSANKHMFHNGTCPWESNGSAFIGFCRTIARPTSVNTNCSRRLLSGCLWYVNLKNLKGFSHTQWAASRQAA